MTSRHYIFALGIGASVGAAIALLFAPQSGVETRHKIKRTADDASDQLEDAGIYLKKQAEVLSKEADRLLKKTRKDVETAIDQAGDVVSGAINTASRLV